MQRTVRPQEIRIGRAHTPAIDVRVDPAAPYVDMFWTPQVGAVGVAVFRAFTRLAIAGPGTVLDLHDLSQWLGVADDAQHREAWHAVEALVDHDLAVWDDDDGTLLVPPSLPVLTASQVAALPRDVQDLHAAWSARLPQADQLHAATAFGFQTLAAFAEEAAADNALSPLRAVQRWQQAMRIASDFSTDLVTWLAPEEAEGLLRSMAHVSRGVTEALWTAQSSLALHGKVAPPARAALQRASASVIDWLVLVDESQSLDDDR